MSSLSTSPKGVRPGDLAVVIVNWNVREELCRCLHTLARAATYWPWGEVHVWVVDNASSDGSVPQVREAFPWVRLIALEENIGFAAANNLALWAMGLLPTLSGPLYSRSTVMASRLRLTPAPNPPTTVLFLNPDTEVAADALHFMGETLYANIRTGVVGPRLVYPDGSHQHSGFRFPTLRQVFLDFFPLHPRLIHSRLNGRYAKILYEGTAPFPVDFVLGAAMMVRREVLDAVGGFDEGYWLYCEEMDWARRVRAAGWEIRVEPRARVVHHEGRSSRQFQGRAFVALWQSRFRYFRRYHGPVFNFLLRWLVRAGVWYLGRRARGLPPAEQAARREAYAQVLQMVWAQQQ